MVCARMNGTDAPADSVATPTAANIFEFMIKNEITVKKTVRESVA